MILLTSSTVTGAKWPNSELIGLCTGGMIRLRVVDSLPVTSRAMRTSFWVKKRLNSKQSFLVSRGLGDVLRSSECKSSRLQLDVRNLSLRRRHLVIAYEVKAAIGVIAGNTVWSMPERLECEVLHKVRYINTLTLLLTPTLTRTLTRHIRSKSAFVLMRISF